MNLVQYLERNNQRKRLPSPGIGVDPRKEIKDLYAFFEAMADLEPEWITNKDPLTEESYQSTDAFRVLNRHTRARVLFIQLEY